MAIDEDAIGFNDPTTKTIGLCMIVKDEAAVIERCLDSVRPLVDYVLIEDTGSSDGTQEIIRSYLRRHGIAGEVLDEPWRDFAHNRSIALARLREKKHIDYALIMDADDILVCEPGFDPVAFKAGLSADRYDVNMHDGAISYHRTQICNNRLNFRYRGVLHEFLEGPPDLNLSGTAIGIHIVSSREGARNQDPHKYEKDIAVLEWALAADEDPSLRARYTFYLAQSYRDAGRMQEAADSYAKRAEMGEWDEEVWYARLQEARCKRSLGDESGFLQAALMAFNQRPQRAEPLHDLAQYYRERGMTEASVLFSEPGLALPVPAGDLLFREDHVYAWGLKEDYAIAANYSRDPARKYRGHMACNWLALSREIPIVTRDLARSNLFFYVNPAKAMMSSFAARRIDFTSPDGFFPMNPSVARRGADIVLLQRTTNCRLVDGRYELPEGEPVTTRNFLLQLTVDLETRSAVEILPPADLPPPAYPHMIGFEDPRLFTWRDGLWCCSTVREMTPEAWCEQVLARIDDRSPGPCRLTDWRVLHPEGPRLHEKNWMPQVERGGDRLQFIYLCDPTRIIDDQAATVTETIPAIAAENFRGGSQVIDFDGGWLALIHEVTTRDGRRFYHHRFVWFDAALVLRRVSRRFHFSKSGIEFAAGLAWHPDGERLLISYGIDDCQSWLATVEAAEVRHILDDAAQIPSGTPQPLRDAAPIIAPQQREGDPKPRLASQTHPRPQIIVSTYHKTGTVLFHSILQAIGEQLGLTMSEQYGFVDKVDPALDIALLSHSLLGADFASRPFRAVRVVRDPRDIWVSGYLYHRRCFEPWCINTDFDPSPPIKFPRVDYSFEHYPESWKRDYLASLGGKSYQQNLLERDQETGLAFELAGYTGCTLQAMHSWNLTPPDLLQVKLEDLTQSFDASMLTIFRHFGLSESECELAVERAARYDVNRWSDEAVQQNRHIHSRQISKWREFLSPAQIRDFEQRYGDLIVSLGYPLSGTAEIDRDGAPNRLPPTKRQVARSPAPAAEAASRPAEASWKEAHLRFSGRPPERPWVPDRPQGGTELMLAEFTNRLGGELQDIDFRVNPILSPGSLPATGKPLVAWFHLDADQRDVQWCRDRELAAHVNVFVFVCDYQRQRYLRAFGLPPEKCVVMRNATLTDAPIRPWRPGKIRHVAYTSTPFRGLSLLLEAWEALAPRDAVLHVWSSLKLYGSQADDTPYQQMFDRARRLPNTIYHGIAPNAELRSALQQIDFIAYPSTFAECDSVAMIEAMTAGCRVICPTLGGLPETTAGFARLYPWTEDPVEHLARFQAVLADELERPWEGDTERATEQQEYCRRVNDWNIRAEEWRRFLKRFQPAATSLAAESGATD